MQQSNSTWNPNEAPEEGAGMATEIFRRITYHGLAGIGALIFLALTYYSFLYTQYMPIRWAEMAEERKGLPQWNLAALLVMGVLAYGLSRLGRLLKEKQGRILEIVVLVLSSAWILVAGLLWVTAIERTLEGDNLYVCQAASGFLQGDYFFLNPGRYCQIYPQQIGQIAVVEMVFALVGADNYFALRLILVLMTVGIHLLGYGILKERGFGFASRILYLLLMMGCIPMICYTSWIYGDIPSTFFLFAFSFLALLFNRKAKWYYVAGMLVSYVLAIMVRKNSMVFLVAFGIIAVMDLVIRKRKRMVIMAALALLGGILSYRIAFSVYELRSGQEIGEGLPINSWIAMGMEENWNGNGWYANTPILVGESFCWDFPAIERYFSSFIRGRLEDFSADPKYAFQFYKKKVLSQWNEPLYQCIFFSKNFSEENSPDKDSFLGRLYQTGDTFELFLFWADRWQFLIYLGMLLYFLTSIRKGQEPVGFLLAVTIVGGIFFSVLWESKARYCMPYYLMMFPLAVMGYACFVAGLQGWMRTISGKMRRKKGEDDANDGMKEK